MRWISPIDYKLIITRDSNSFQNMKENETGLPIFPHVGAFGVKRKYHIHEGVDLYCPEGTQVRAVNDGIVVGIVDFTGESVNSPWWEDTKAVLVKTLDGIVVYGEILPDYCLTLHQEIKQGDIIGYVKRVLKDDKGRPMSMLHLELYKDVSFSLHGHHPLIEWKVDECCPSILLDPTPFLANLAENKRICTTGTLVQFYKHKFFRKGHVQFDSPFDKIVEWGYFNENVKTDCDFNKLYEGVKLDVEFNNNGYEIPNIDKISLNPEYKLKPWWKRIFQ